MPHHLGEGARTPLAVENLINRPSPPSQKRTCVRACGQTGLLRRTRQFRLMLLGSPPDMVHGALSHRAVRPHARAHVGCSHDKPHAAEENAAACEVYYIRLRAVGQAKTSPRQMMNFRYTTPLTFFFLHIIGDFLAILYVIFLDINLDGFPKINGLLVIQVLIIIRVHT